MRTSYGFHFNEPIPERLCVLESVGWGEAVDAGYGQDGLRRAGSGHLFQYTLAGEGAITVAGQTYRVPKHHGFFATIPSDHRYYYPPDGRKPWEFVWIRAKGGPMSDHWRHFIRVFGHVAAFRPDSEPVRLLWSLYREAGAQGLRDKYRMSLRLTEWLLAFERMAEGRDAGDRPLPDSLRRAKLFMESRVGDTVTLDDVAAAAGMSKHHFCKVYKAHTGVTPIHHLRKIRVEEAARLLRNTGLSVEEVSRQTGFDNVSYFGKVFRQFVGTTPSEYRKGQSNRYDGRQLQIVD
ncbi:AraC family transcriptional regulator [Paenibacillus sp. GYB003]|uniref:AraC family transcriptional regulator n=1 Tax=Paenibacillus sp. GYB003 TaxID=2994392 RepID=UPI002F96C491